MDFKLNKDAHKLIDCATTYASKNDLNVSLSLISGILLKYPDKSISYIFTELHINTKNLSNHILQHVKKHKDTYTTDDLNKLLNCCNDIKKQYNQKLINPGHLLLGVLMLLEPITNLCLSKSGIKFLDIKYFYESYHKILTNNQYKIPTNLEFCIQHIKEIELHDYYTRPAKYEEYFVTLARKNQSNILFTGEKDVGCEEVVIELLSRIHTGYCPPSLESKDAYIIDIKDVLNLGMYPDIDTFKQVLNQIISFIESNHSSIFYFKNITDALAKNIQIDIQNVFLDILFNNNIKYVIILYNGEEENLNLSIFDELEYSFIEHEILSLNKADTLTTVLQQIEYYEQFHKTTYTEEFLEDIVNFSFKFYHEINQPKAAFDLLDDVTSYYYAINTQNFHPDFFIQKKYYDKLQYHKQKLIDSNNYNLAIEVEDAQQNLWRNNVKNNIQLIDFDQVQKLDSDLIKKYISYKFDIPVDSVSGFIPNIEELEKNIRLQYVSQQRAVTDILKHFQRCQLGLHDTNKPIASFLFTGPSGVGKTYLSKLFSQYIFGDDSKLLKLDMSEFMNKENLSKMIGSPPGYIGYKEKCILGDFIIANPFSIILFDEIEKAHPDILNIFLQILDSGVLTDNSNRKLDFTNCIIIFTSNATAEIDSSTSCGFTQSVVTFDDYHKQLKKFFKIEFLNRLDKIIKFDSLQDDELLKLVKINLNNFIAKINKIYKTIINYDDDVIDHIKIYGFDKQYGARFLKRYMIDFIENPILDFLIQNSEEKNITCKLNNNKLQITNH
jgi:ATP-dependent Clp protease ATP-binding subunit ClpA